MSSPPSYLSSSSANALISELRPTTLSPPALNQVNLLLDELLYSLIYAAKSINPKDLRVRGIAGVFSTAESTGARSLGRSAVGEAELELRSWYESHPFARKSNVGFPPDGKGQGLVADRINSPFPQTQAVELLRLRCVALSVGVDAPWARLTGKTLAPQAPPSKALENSASSVWRSVGGDASEETVAPAALWITAILEHVCERILSQLARVVSRDSSVSAAGLQELYIALCEDESVFGFFKRMKVKDTLEAAIRSTMKRPVQSQPMSNGRESPASPRASRLSLDGSREASIASRDSFDFTRSGGISGGQARKTSKGPLNGGHQRPSSGGGGVGHQRSSSVLSVNARTMPGAFGENGEPDTSFRSPQEEEDEFDALVRSNETMKVSLTPNRLKTFEMSTGRGSPQNAIRKAHLTPPPADSMPSNVSSPAETSRTPPRAGLKNRSGSSKLLARDAMTIEEQHDEDEDAAGPSKPRKESLVEALSAEHSPDERPTNRKGSTPRTVPAVVLGTPPPAFPDRLPPSSPSLNRPNRDIGDEEDGPGYVPLRRKSSAQELADFFNNTPAPPTTATTSPPISSKNKGLKSFISKVTGKRKEDERAPTPTLTSASTTRVNMPLGEAIGPRRQKSLVNVGAMSTPPSSYRHEDAPPVPARSMLRKKSRDLSAGSNEAITILKPLQSVESNSGTTRSASDQGGASETSPRIPSSPPAVAEPSAQQLHGQSNGLDSSQKAEAAFTPSQTNRSAEPTTGIEEQPIPSATSLLPIDMQTSGRSIHETSMSDINSFRTAEEGEGSVEEHDRSDDTKGSGGIAQTENVMAAKGTVNTPSDLVNRSIPFDDLVPLRNLLQHATSATECRLLLSAILTQWGIPQSPTDSSAPGPTPESRVTAWLLAGRDGPVVQITPSSSTFSKLYDEVVTPTQNHTARLPDVPEIASTASGNDEELLSSETTSMASADEAEIHEGRPGSLAMSSQRHLPIVAKSGEAGRELGSALGVRLDKKVTMNGGSVSAGV